MTEDIDVLDQGSGEILCDWDEELSEMELPLTEILGYYDSPGSDDPIQVRGTIRWTETFDWSIEDDFVGPVESGWEETLFKAMESCRIAAWKWIKTEQVDDQPTQPIINHQEETHVPPQSGEKV